MQFSITNKAFTMNTTTVSNPKLRTVHSGKFFFQRFENFSLINERKSEFQLVTLVEYFE